MRKMLIAGGMLTMKADAFAATPFRKPMKDPLCTVFRSVNGSPSQNLAKILEMMGGIEKIVGRDDIVLIKPNVQWWNQGAPNLSALKAFVDLTMARPGGFHGEVIIAENCHRGPDPSRSTGAGWANRFDWNSDVPDVNNMNELTALLKKQYGKRFSKIHWINAATGGRRVFGPAEGPGYVYCDGTGGVPLIRCDNGRDGGDHRATIMTYPIFVTDRGTTVDFKNGIWSKGSYTGQPLRFINMSALNHHSTYCGITSSIKNYMGITDLSGGPDPHEQGRLTADYYNFHSFPFNKWAPGPAAGMLGKEIGSFMKTIRKADLNITTAEWVGLSSRTELPLVRTRAVLASTDPVALDYHGAKYLLYPNSGITVHDPDYTQGPLNQYLEKCAEQYGGFFYEEKVSIKSYDLGKGTLQNDNELALVGARQWGWRPRPILKYLYLRVMG